ncbi:pentapeptide repeat-containing protein [Lentzea sp. JNUCC 0626]|uniref:pentapeptide repeat-containing protein n=1 Tax=Lentzea sp. JNUCC 0626 TaxID=3367513 RepID=UPI003747F843
MADDPSRPTFTPTWPLCATDGCTGRRIETFSACLEHLRNSELDIFLERIGRGGDLDLRGTVLGPKNLDRLLAALNSGRGTRFGKADFSYCTFHRYWDKAGQGPRVEGVIPFNRAVFDGAARFVAATFEGGVTFWGTSFLSGTSFEGAVFRGRTSFSGVEVSGDALFSGARFEGETDFGLSKVESVRLGAAFFAKRAYVVVKGESVTADEARFEGGVEFYVHDASVRLERTYFGGPSSVNGAESKARVLSVRGTDLSDLTFANVDLSQCLFAGAHQVDKVRLEGWTPFAEPPNGWRIGWAWPPVWRWGRRQVLAEEFPWRARHTKRAGWTSPTLAMGLQRDNTGAERLAVMYRSLRKALEDGKNEAGAGDFYYGEMEARRHSRSTKGGERAVLWAYWLLSGYGQRASRAFGALIVLVGLLTLLLTSYGLPDGTALQQMTGTIPPAVAGVPQQVVLEVKPGPVSLPADRWTADRASKAVRIALGSVVFREADQRLTPAGVWTVMAGRAFGPLLLALAVLAIRARVKR